MAFLALLLVAMVVIKASPARYDWEGADWKVVNNASLKVFQAGMGYGSFRQVEDGRGRAISSDNQTLCLAFLDLNNTGNFYLSVMLGVLTNQAVPIWTANRNTPVTDNAAVQILSGEMRLVDSQNQRVWSPFQLVIRGMELSENGNLRLFDDQDATLWQTFDNPCDVLMPGQRFPTGSKLVASSERSGMAEGVFMTSVEASGLALYLRSSDAMVAPQAYSISTMQNTTVKRQLSTVLRQCPSYHAVFSFSSADFVLEYEAKDNSTAASGLLPCSGPRRVHFPFVDTSLGLRFLRLEHTGDLVSHGFDSRNGSWRADFSWESLVKDKVCPTPLACGRYGMCQSGGSAPCKCLSSATQRYEIESATACPAPPPVLTAETCSSQTSQLVDFLGVSYFPNKLLQPDMVSPLDSCLERCKASCSCSAIFYSKNSSGCYFFENILGSLDFDATAVVQYSAHLKFGSNGVKSGHSNSRRAGKIAGIAVAAALALLVVSVAFVLGLRKRKRLKEEELTMRSLSLLSAMPGSAPHRFSYQTLKEATRGFTEKLGSGGFGSVYAGTLANGARLAVKALEMKGGHGDNQFVAEVVSLGRVSHVNIVRLCGYCVHGSSRLLVYEHVKNGSLDQWLFRGAAAGRCLSWESRWRIALGTAKGVAYLHEECRDPILHLDIKPQNILLDEEFVAKVSDFGMSKLLTSKDITQVVTGVRGTPGYLAPEWLLNSIATKKCDVYSYGMVLFELISGRRNVEPESSGNALDWYFPLWAVNEFRQGRLLDVVDEKIRSVEIFPLVEMLFKVALWCIQDSPSVRPSMSRVVQMLDGACAVPAPPLDFQFYFLQQHEAFSNQVSSAMTPISMSIEAR